MTSLDINAVEQWIHDDPDMHTVQELQDLLTKAQSGDSAAADDLADRFSGDLEFGTAGLRGQVGGGPHRMNRAVVMRAAYGLSTFLHDHLGDGFSVVIGYDARYGSHQFALDTAGVVTAAGGRAFLLPRVLPTPQTAFAIRSLSADAAVMVTASHNPPQDNGYKVYLGGRAVSDGGQGAQIVPPLDNEIARHIKNAPPARDVPRAENGWVILQEDIVQAFRHRVMSLIPDVKALSDEARDARARLRIVLTSCHGVGGTTMLRILHDCGFTNVFLVGEQHEPNPDFPTLSFPNPEEPGALDLAQKVARDVHADLIIANDPDADRCSLAVPDNTTEGGWRQLSGDQIGSILGLLMAEKYQDTYDHEPTPPVLANSVVSSRLLSEICHTYHVKHQVTLTGFKWISRVEGLVFGYEEAIGYCVDPQAVRDKDGIAASLVLAEIAASRHAAGSSLLDILNELATTYGLYATSPLNVRVDDLSIIDSAMLKLRAQGMTQLSGSPVVTTQDLSHGSDDLPPTNALIFTSENKDRVIVRPSGTEPKLKCYCEVIIPVEGDDVDEAQRVANKRLETIHEDVKAALGI